MTAVKQDELFGSVLLKARVERGFTQDQLVERCGNVLSKSYLSYLERGDKNNPSPDISDALADALGEARNRFRALAGLPLLDDETRDELADRFAYALEMYKSLSPGMRELAEKHIKQTMDIFVEADKQPRGTGRASEKRSDTQSDTSVASQTVNVMPLEDIPTMSQDQIEDLRRKARKENRRGGKK